MNLLTNPVQFEDHVIKSLKAIRKNKKISQTELAKRLAVSRDTIARIELGKHQLRLQMVVKLANALDIALQDILFEKENNVIEKPAVSTSNPNVKIGFVGPYSAPSPSKILRKSSPPDGPVVGTKAGETASDPTPPRNPYLDEVAVKSYGNPMKQYILEHRLFWHWVPEDKLAGLSIASVVEATLNQGKDADIKWLFDTIGVIKAADIFKWGISGFRTNYREDTVSFFDAYFKRHVPEYTHV